MNGQKITFNDIITSSGITTIPTKLALNKSILLDPKLFDSLSSESPKHRKRTYDFDVFLPDYGVKLQRPYVWESHQQKNFIVNVLLGKPIDEFIVVEDEDDDNNVIVLVIDGKQRLMTIRKFIHNQFPITVFGKDVYYDDFDTELKMLFRRYVNSFVATVYYSDSYARISDKDKILLFNYYNFSGTPQTEEHKEMLEKLIGE